MWLVGIATASAVAVISAVIQLIRASSREKTQSIQGSSPGKSGSITQKARSEVDHMQVVVKDLRSSYTSIDTRGAIISRRHRFLSNEIGPSPKGFAPLDVFLSDEADHEQVERAVGAWAATAGFEVVFGEEPEIGSWYRRLWVRSQEAARSPLGQEFAATALHSAELKTHLAWEAQVTATLMAQVPPLLASLQSTKDAVIRLGAVLIVKVDWTVCVTQLTAAQQLRLNHRPELLKAPGKILAALEVPAEQSRTIAPEGGRDLAAD